MCDGETGHGSDSSWLACNEWLVSLFFFTSFALDDVSFFCFWMCDMGSCIGIAFASGVAGVWEAKGDENCREPGNCRGLENCLLVHSGALEGMTP